MDLLILLPRLLHLNPEPLTMSPKPLAERQAEELDKLEQHILKHVSKRLWTKEQLLKGVEQLYLLGMKHGSQLASVIQAMAVDKELEKKK